MPLEIGQVLEDKYRIVRLIGQGGMGAVYEGENARIRRRVAIKVLHAMAAENPELIARFEHEAQAAGQIGSDHILEVLDLGVLPDGDRYLVMEYLDGEPLSDRIHRLGRLSPADAVPILAQVLSGLAAAHRAGIVHRDLKPENIFILKEKAGQPDFVKIIDFGISKFQSTGPEMRMTRTGAVLGTPYYMSPEQASGKSVDARSDIYSVGVILYEVLTGRTPFDGKSYNELILKIVLSTPPPPAAIVPDLPPALCAIVERAMGREPEQRFQTAEEFAQALVGWGRGRASAGQTVVLPEDLGQLSPPGFAPPPGAVSPSRSDWAGTPAGPALTPNRIGSGLQSGQRVLGSSAHMGPLTPMGDQGPAGVRPIMGSGTVTGANVSAGAWCQTGAEEFVRRANHGRWIAVAIVVVLICSGGAFGLVRYARSRVSVIAPAETAAKHTDETVPLEKQSSIPANTAPPMNPNPVDLAPDAGPELPRESPGVSTSTSTNPRTMPAPPRTGGGGGKRGPRTQTIKDPSPPPATVTPVNPAPPNIPGVGGLGY